MTGNEKSDIHVEMIFFRQGKVYHKVAFNVRVNTDPENRNSPIYSIVSRQEQRTNLLIE